MVIPIQGPDYYLQQRVVIEKFEDFAIPPPNYVVDKWLTNNFKIFILIETISFLFKAAISNTTKKSYS